MANGVATVRPGVAFDVLVGNIGHINQSLPKGMVLATALRHPVYTVSMGHTLTELLNIEAQPADSNQLDVREKENPQ